MVYCMYVVIHIIGVDMCISGSSSGLCPHRSRVIFFVFSMRAWICRKKVGYLERLEITVDVLACRTGGRGRLVERVMVIDRVRGWKSGVMALVHFRSLVALACSSNYPIWLCYVCQCDDCEVGISEISHWL